MSESVSTVTDLVPLLTSNLALIYNHQRREKDSILKGREALISAAQLYPKNSPEVC